MAPTKTRLIAVPVADELLSVVLDVIETELPAKV
jgi:hypothetical protein